MKRVLILALAIFLMIPAPVAASTFYVPPPSSPQTTQCKYIRTTYPSRTDNWPYCRVGSTAVLLGHVDRPMMAAADDNEFAWTDSSCGTYPQPKCSRMLNPYDCVGGGLIVAACQGWDIDGFYGMWHVRMGVWVHWYEAIPTGREPQMAVSCTLISAVGFNLEPLKCGFLGWAPDGNWTHFALGFRYKTTSPMILGFIPSATVWWRGYVICKQYQEGSCSAPIVSSRG